MADLTRIRVYPIKSLDGEDLGSGRVTGAGHLAHDREYALFDSEGDPVNGTRTARVHDIDTSFDVDTGGLTVRGDGETRTFDFPAERAAAADWFSDVFDLDISIERDAERGFVSRRDAGPSVISTATLAELASWYDGATVDGMRRRVRANLEVDGVEPFWEDRFLGEDAPVMDIGDVRMEGVEPCARCVVPERDPDTGERDSGFRERFVERRRETFPEFADESAFEHHYTAMLIASVPDAARGERLRVGDPVTVHRE